MNTDRTGDSRWVGEEDDHVVISLYYLFQPQTGALDRNTNCLGQDRVAELAQLQAFSYGALLKPRVTPSLHFSEAQFSLIKSNGRGVLVKDVV